MHLIIRLSDCKILHKLRILLLFLHLSL